LHREGAPERVDCNITAEQAADALGLATDVVPGLPWRAGYGFPFVFVRVSNVAAVSASSLRVDRWLALSGTSGGDPYVFAFTGMASGTATLRARMFGASQGISEDPATGSAAAALAGSITGRIAGDTLRLTIEQGVEMGRPSRIETETRYADGRVTSISVGGGAVIVGEGRLLRLP
jgi:trans-2,3-dihydro-3-hydroxyanthranilate isomerase